MHQHPCTSEPSRIPLSLYWSRTRTSPVSPALREQTPQSRTLGDHTPAPISALPSPSRPSPTPPSARAPPQPSRGVLEHHVACVWCSSRKAAGSTTLRGRAVPGGLCEPGPPLGRLSQQAARAGWGSLSTALTDDAEGSAPPSRETSDFRGTAVRICRRPRLSAPRPGWPPGCPLARARARRLPVPPAVTPGPPSAGKLWSRPRAACGLSPAPSPPWQDARAFSTLYLARWLSFIKPHSRVHTVSADRRHGGTPFQQGQT